MAEESGSASVEFGEICMAGKRVCVAEIKSSRQVILELELLLHKMIRVTQYTYRVSTLAWY